MPSQTVWTTLKLLTWTKEYLTSKGIKNARLEAEWLLCSATGLDRVGLYLHFEKPLNKSELDKYRTMVSRRGKREPLQHILGSQEFAGLDFVVTADVLIPRFDTEVLLNEAAKRCNTESSVLDIGTGSGCLAIALKKQLPKATVTATDISEKALAIACLNASAHKTEINFLLGSLYYPIAGYTFDLIISNPPYIPTADIFALEMEVRDYDPMLALDGGNDGLAIYRSLIPEAPAYLNPGGWLLVEIGIHQAEAICQIFKGCRNFYEPFVSVDLFGIERVVGAQRKEV